MTRINTNMPSLLSALYMNRNMELLSRALERLATGKRLNSAADDPSGIIASDVLRGELTGIKSAISNAERANNLMGTAEGSMASISDMLLELKSHIFAVANDGGMTSAELSAKQLEVDNTIQAIDQVVKSATFAGQALLDGSLSYTTQSVDNSVIDDLAIHKAPIGASNGGIPVSVALQVPAERASLIFPNATVAAPVTLRVRGPEGTEQLKFVAGTTSTEIALAVNGITEQTGLIAELVNGNPLQGVRIMTDDYGTASSVSIEVVEGLPASFATEDEAGVPAARDAGVDIELTINGSTVVGEGLMAHYASATMGMELWFDPAWGTGALPASTNFEITSGGALFQIGSQISTEQQDSIGIGTLDSTSLGRSTLGYLGDLGSGGDKTLQSGRFRDMIRVVDEAARQVASARARVGSFQNNTLDVAINSLRQTQERISSARSLVLDTDYAVETALVTRQEILAEATRSAMAMANRVPQQVLSLLLD